MEIVVFIIRKSDNSFRSYNILKQSHEKAVEAVANFNKVEGKEDRAEIITDPHVVAAILAKDSRDTIKSYFAEVKEECDRLKKELQDNIRCVENSLERMVEYAEEKFEDAPHTEEQARTTANSGSTK